MSCVLCSRGFGCNPQVPSSSTCETYSYLKVFFSFDTRSVRKPPKKVEFARRTEDSARKVLPKTVIQVSGARQGVVKTTAQRLVILNRPG